MRRPLLLSAALALPLAFGCVGSIDEPGERSGPTTTPKGQSGGVCAVGPAPLRRLTRAEYDNTVFDLLGDASSPASAFPEDEKLGGFSEGATVSPLLVELYQGAAEQLAATAVADLSKHTSCAPESAGEPVCARQFIESFGKRAFRRPLQPMEIDELLALYHAERAQEDYASSIELVISAILQSPRFLYRPEHGSPALGDSGGRVTLRPHELATRLSYFLWQTMPDDELLGRADDGSLTDPVVLAEEARRMLADDRARAGVGELFVQWMHLGELQTLTKSEVRFPELTPKLKQAMVQETRRFVEHVIFDGDGKLSTLLTANFTFVNAELAPLYGVAPPASGWAKVTLDPAERAGLLTHPSVMTVFSGPEQTSPVYRGLFVREALLCQTPPPPPENLVVNPPDPDPSLSTRERYEAHTADPSCSGCHELMDPIGFGFEHYDAIGRHRTMDAGFPVDASGAIVGTEHTDAEFVGARELAGLLASSPDVSACVASQWYRFAVGRGEAKEDECALASINETFAKSGGDIRELVVAIVTSEAFRYRPAMKESQP
ncbi:MAG: DUF1592 domain-containing protein [Polyangiaceae bacterium]|nr:DUF1592 domain-containing protein [Polyangiaceae bacterium]